MTTLYFTFTGTITGASADALFAGAAFTGAPYTLYYSVNTANSDPTLLGFAQGWDGPNLGQAELVIGGYGLVINPPTYQAAATLYGTTQGHGSDFSWINFDSVNPQIELQQLFGPNMPLLQTTPYSVAADSSQNNAGFLFINNHVTDIRFVANGVTMSLDAPDIGNIQNVSLVPEPATWLLLLIGFALLGKRRGRSWSRGRDLSPSGSA